MKKLILLSLLALFSCDKKNNTEPAETKALTYCESIPWSTRPYGTVKDIDGNTYKTVKIGNQRWMAENLRTTRYSNGDPIPYVKGNDEWSNLTTGAYCWYIDSIDIDDDGTKDYGVSYKECAGNLYNFYVVEDTRNVCPTGWHVPSEAEWVELIEFDRQYSSGAGVGTSLSPVEAWPSDVFEGSQFNDDLGFRALPVGNLIFNFHYFKSNGNWWTSDEADYNDNDNDNGRSIEMWIGGAPIFSHDGYLDSGGGSFPADIGLSIRCVKD